MNEHHNTQETEDAHNDVDHNVSTDSDDKDDHDGSDLSLSDHDDNEFVQSSSPSLAVLVSQQPPNPDFDVHVHDDLPPSQGESQSSPTTATSTTTTNNDNNNKSNGNSSEATPLKRNTTQPPETTKTKTANATTTTTNASVVVGDGPVPKKLRRRHRQGRLTMRHATIEAAATSTTVPKPPTSRFGLLLPLGQYETVLYRRAIRKPTSATSSSTATMNDNNNNNTSTSTTTTKDENQLLDDHGREIYGDTSLGMKLSVMGGKVIVQALTPLADGRASPAQLSGMIQRGDVLLQINHTSIVNLPIDQLMKGLSPLSTPDDTTTGIFARTIRLRLASGRGLHLLQQQQQQHSTPERTSPLSTSPNHHPAAVVRTPDPAADMFTLFPMMEEAAPPPPMVTPPSSPHRQTTSTEIPHKTVETENKEEEKEESETEESALLSLPLGEKVPTLDEMIGDALAEERLLERKKVISEFFSSHRASISLSLQYRGPGVGIHKTRIPAGDDGENNDTIENNDENTNTDNDTLAGLSPAEVIDIGTKALKGAKALSAIMERVDKGSDRRSFQSLSATLSLYSRASTRRRYVLDGRAMPVNFDKVQEAALTEEEEEDNDDDDTDAGSTANSDEGGEQLDGDELLLQLAATDEIWRKQVIDFLEQVIDQNLDDSTDDSTTNNMDANIDLSNELGSFLFGTNMSEVLKKQRKSHALPPPEITSLLFDLTTKISSTIPDRIKAEGDPITVRSSLVPFIGMKRPAAESNIMLANHFLLDQVLPLWLKSFRPLPLDQRRMMWPPDRAQALDSTAGSTLSGDDSLTVDSMMTRNTGTGTAARSRKNLREQIEDNELDPESRAETCFLTTYYFTQHLLPRLLNRGLTADQVKEVVEELVDFVSQFGSYLRLHTCLAYAAVLKSSRLIDSLLEVAKFDPRHREVMKQTSRPSALVIYDSTMLSAVMQRLRDIRTTKLPERQRATINLCFQAYPDLRPWQVKKECYGHSNSESDQLENEKGLASLYYSYLCLLLHPTDGHDGARHDPSLVKEFCTLSVKGKVKNAKRRNNFLRVASKTSSDHLAYTRDLSLLLKLSMDTQEFDLALDLAAEILDTNTNLNSEKALRVLVAYITNIGRRGVDGFLEDKDRGTRVMKRVLRLYNRVSALGTKAAKSVVNVPLELLTLLEHAETAPVNSQDGVIELIAFFSEEARPEDVLEALVGWHASTQCDDRLYPIYQTILKRAAQSNMWKEMSGSLHRVIQAHSRFEESVGLLRPADQNLTDGHTAQPSKGLWEQLSHGALLLEK